MMAILDVWMALSSSDAISPPLWRLTSSLKVGMPASSKARCSCLVMLYRVSSPLKLKNTSCLHLVAVDKKENDDACTLLVVKVVIVVTNWVFTLFGRS